MAVYIFIVTGYHRHVGFVGDYYADPGGLAAQLLGVCPRLDKRRFALDACMLKTDAKYVQHMTAQGLASMSWKSGEPYGRLRSVSVTGIAFL